MSVISPARTRPAPVNYDALNTSQQNLFDQLMDRADNTTSAAEYEALMAALIAITGITGVRYNEILKCACPACICGRIFDADDPDALVTEAPDGYNLGRLQCPDCADDHPRPVED
ncbi:hypothetical protein [Streptomyces sp. ML-6]|uniref:hypothetical protein n=1 Tax=Streptomyces sp. ML-6 TaxID=2982693 RepID=UPI0024C0782A|nr:hypothetical protein [Streptomyces sp. ML-6]MDK0525052.1 hypothetical protein [Streptomyces sp. ML-6]